MTSHIWCVPGVFVSAVVCAFISLFFLPRRGGCGGVGPFGHSCRVGTIRSLSSAPHTLPEPVAIVSRGANDENAMVAMRRRE